MAMERDEQGRGIIRLDGSLGLGPMAKLSVITADKVEGIVTHVYECPYSIVNFKVLQHASDNNFILGFGVEKIMPQDEQPIQFTVGSPQEEDQ